MFSKVVALIPCAGLGTRSGMLPHQSKELLKYEGTALLKWHIQNCRKYNIEPLVITRKEKISLHHWCDNNDVKYVLIEPDEGEWCNTLLKASDFWGEKNILLLPDTRFSDVSVMVNMKHQLLNNNKNSIARHWVADGDKWGMVRTNYKDDVIVTEKPKNMTKGWAWGILAFNKNQGIDLLTNLRDNKKTILKNVTMYNLKTFKDVTR